MSVSGLSVRLFGIDAPEAKQACSRQGVTWACGEQANAQLQSLVEGKVVRCERQTIDIYGRPVSICYADGEDVGKAMVMHGWAVAFTRYSPRYVADQEQAKAGRIGIWDSEFEMPQDYRARLRMAEFAPDEPQPAARPVSNARPSRANSPSGCVIKGNHSRRGEWIYHLPGMPYYEQTRPEAWFCTEAEAQAAGYRRAKVQ